MNAGADPDRFSVELLWNGFFCGLHECMLYMEGTLDFFDNCNADTLSILWIEDFLRQLGIEINEKMTVYWCLPVKYFSDGLVEIRNDAHIVDMIDAAKENKVLCLYVDHTNFVKGPRSDALKHARPQKPAVLSAQEIHGDDYETIVEEAHDRNDVDNEKVAGEEIQSSTARGS
jgi:hypothetical protein